MNWSGSAVIERYRDHAANERTYLAWVRTGIMDSFETFLTGLSGTVTEKAHQVASPGTPYVGVALAVLGVLVILGGAVRFIRIKRDLDTAAIAPYLGAALRPSLAVLLMRFGAYLMLYLARVMRGPAGGYISPALGNIPQRPES